MILNPEHRCAILLNEWHYWWPWVPIRLTPTYEFRWLFVVQRKKEYNWDGKCTITQYRDVPSA